MWFPSLYSYFLLHNFAKIMYFTIQKKCVLPGLIRDMRQSYEGTRRRCSLAVSTKHVKFLFSFGHAPPSTQLPPPRGKAKRNGPSIPVTSSLSLPYPQQCSFWKLLSLFRSPFVQSFQSTGPVAQRPPSKLCPVLAALDLVAPSRYRVCPVGSGDAGFPQHVRQSCTQESQCLNDRFQSCAF